MYTTYFKYTVGSLEFDFVLLFHLACFIVMQMNAGLFSFHASALHQCYYVC